MSSKGVLTAQCRKMKSPAEAFALATTPVQVLLGVASVESTLLRTAGGLDAQGHGGSVREPILRDSGTAGKQRSIDRCRWSGAAVRSGAARFNLTVCLTCRYGVTQNLCRIPIDADSCWREFDGEL